MFVRNKFIVKEINFQPWSKFGSIIHNNASSSENVHLHLYSHIKIHRHCLERFRTVFASKQCLICACFSPDSDDTTFSLEKSMFERTHILFVRVFVSYKHAPCWKSSIWWLGMFWSMVAGLNWFKLVLVMSWSWAGASCLGPAHDQLKQLKQAAVLQNIPNHHMLLFFPTEQLFFLH